MSNTITSPEFFEAKYQREPDPWSFASSSYELQRYAAIVGSLGSRTFQRAFEPGCSIGVLTEKLAVLCKHVEALDVSVTAGKAAIQRCRHLKNVDIRIGSLASDTSAHSFDLLVLSEIGYYFEAATLTAIGNGLASRLVRGGVLLGAHWLGSSADHLLSGDQVHEILNGLPGLTVSFAELHSGFRINHWTKQ
jgi:2-polyprenyl-3-methyl-5-hydroxy-6-metoxy-1,4-benzoquinol methylase